MGLIPIRRGCSLEITNGSQKKYPIAVAIAKLLNVSSLNWFMGNISMCRKDKSLSCMVSNSPHCISR